MRLRKVNTLLEFALRQRILNSYRLFKSIINKKTINSKYKSIVNLKYMT